MSHLGEVIWGTLAQLDIRGIVDILIIAVIVYRLLLLLRGTTAMSLLRGIVIVFLIGFLLSNVIRLTMVSWLLRNSFTALLIAIPIIFQPELRRALERLGSTGFLTWGEAPRTERIVGVVTKTCMGLVQRGHGGLIVVERSTGLNEYIDTGVPIDAVASADLLVGMFIPSSPLHDGAAILRGDRVIAASCVLPLSENYRDNPYMGTRHRAALGITESTDAVAVVVSEETRGISVANKGRMVRLLDEARLERVLTGLLASGAQPVPRWWEKIRSNNLTPVHGRPYSRKDAGEVKRPPAADKEHEVELAKD